ncbi:DUF3618 domain-containing protein [Georgenia sp. AZ-5]|uniref:DUF3618 domain-containing protein n=1 Tax=Georgenia sp. AZ-5 TaxID=3367526 RepID=UPI0037552131
MSSYDPTDDTTITPATSTDPDRIRADIEATRTSLSGNVDALTEKVSPARIAERQSEKVRGAVSGVKDRVFGAAEDAREAALGAKDSATGTVRGAAGSVREGAGSAAETAKAAPGQVKARAEGNPLAAGLVAFGLGLLGASLIPSSRQERQVVGQVKDSDALQAVTAEARGAAQEMGQALREPARAAAQDVKDTATTGAQDVKDTATTGAQDVKDTATTAGQDVKDQAQHSTQTVKDTGTSENDRPGMGSAY